MGTEETHPPDVAAGHGTRAEYLNPAAEKAVHGFDVATVADTELDCCARSSLLPMLLSAQEHIKLRFH